MERGKREEGRYREVDSTDEDRAVHARVLTCKLLVQTPPWVVSAFAWVSASSSKVSLSCLFVLPDGAVRPAAREYTRARGRSYGGVCKLI
jgi:hypothetical protein